VDSAGGVRHEVREADVVVSDDLAVLQAAAAIAPLQFGSWAEAFDGVMEPTEEARDTNQVPFRAEPLRPALCASCCLSVDEGQNLMAFGVDAEHPGRTVESD